MKHTLNKIVLLVPFLVLCLNGCKESVTESNNTSTTWVIIRTDRSIYTVDDTIHFDVTSVYSDSVSLPGCDGRVAATLQYYQTDSWVSYQTWGCSSTIIKLEPGGHLQSIYVILLPDQTFLARYPCRLRLIVTPDGYPGFHTVLYSNKFFFRNQREVK